ncbi:MAG: lysophospholipid acyltransferase family protein [Candidatus Omnitrophota bacterium]
MSPNLKEIRRAVLRALMIGFHRSVRFIPYGLFKPLTRAVQACCFALFGARLRRNAARTITQAYGDQLSESEKKEIISGTFRHFGKVLTEDLYYSQRPEYSDRVVDIAGREHLDRALAAGKGAVVVSAHFGNFPLMIFYLRRAGYLSNAVIRPLRDRKIGRYAKEMMAAHGVGTVYSKPARRCVRESVETLRQNKLLFVLMDQHYGTDARVEVDFFGRPAAAGASPVVLARRTGAAVIPAFIVRDRDDDDRHRIEILPPLDLEQGGTQEQVLQKNMQTITDVIERYVRRYPCQWGWMHRRWKDG